jgi:dienelactone hydrolase
MIGDAYRALELLATHPRIDPARITVMGFSKGGGVALYAALTRFQRLQGSANARFAHHIAFYPPCFISYIGDEAVTDRPIRLFQGTADDLAPVDRCRSYVERLRRAGADAQLTAYDGAHHQFDRPSDAPARRWQPFSLDDPCVFRGGTFGDDPAAYRAALHAREGAQRNPGRAGEWTSIAWNRRLLPSGSLRVLNRRRGNYVL